MVQTNLSTMWCYFVLWICVIVQDVMMTCDFPDYMQTAVNQRDWQTRVKSQATEFTMTVLIQDHLIKMVASESSDEVSEERVCIQSLSDDEFITAAQGSNWRDTQYMCTQFLKRSENVVQLRTSLYSSSMTGLCEDDQLTTDPWILIDNNHVFDDSELCPLTGGFAVRLFDKEYHQGVCDAFSDNVWIESECVQGSGLQFNFLYTRCIPNVLMARHQRTICVASWTEGQYDFSLLRHNTRTFMWILRYPASLRTSFVSYLMKDLYASTDPYLSDTNMYVKMDMVQDIPRPVTSLCTDQLEGCSVWSNPCGINDDTSLTCPRTCGLCNATRPALCSFDSTWQGDWIDASHGDRVATTFEPNVLTVYYEQLDQKFHCIQWDQPYSGPKQRHTTHEMLVTEHSNGCRPKYSCVKIVNIPSSPIMFIQLSVEKPWPFTSLVADQINCDSFAFDGNEENIFSNRYRGNHYKMLYSKSLDHGTSCNFPLQDQRNFSASLSDDTLCAARIDTDISGRSISLNLTSCIGGRMVGALPKIHECVESSRLLSNNDLLVVTNSPGETFQLYCWLFPRRPSDYFYLVEVSHCNENTKRKIVKGRIKPLAIFSRYGFHTSTAIQDNMVLSTTTLSSHPSVSISHSGENSIIGSTPSLTNASKANVTVTNSTSSDLHPARVASPIAVVAALIFFVVFQIPCYCKNA